jgi:hypothetical protein
LSVDLLKKGLNFVEVCVSKENGCLTDLFFASGQILTHWSGQKQLPGVGNTV